MDFSFFFFSQKTAYEVRISDLSSDVCSSDLESSSISSRISRPQTGLSTTDRTGAGVPTAPALDRCRPRLITRTIEARRQTRPNIGASPATEAARQRPRGAEIGRAHV